MIEFRGTYRYRWEDPIHRRQLSLSLRRSEASASTAASATMNSLRDVLDEADADAQPTITIIIEPPDVRKETDEDSGEEDDDNINRLSGQIYTGDNPADKEYNNVVMRLLPERFWHQRVQPLLGSILHWSASLSRPPPQGPQRHGHRHAQPHRPSQGRNQVRGEFYRGEVWTFSAKITAVGEKMVFTSLKDKRIVRMLSTEHPATMQRVRQRRHRAAEKMKPTSVVCYNNKKFEVDLSDQLEGTYLFALTSRKYWKKMEFYILNAMVTNAYILQTRWLRSYNAFLALGAEIPEGLDCFLFYRFAKEL